jgi:hypothetical protein
MNLADWLQADHEPSERLQAAASLCRAVTERAGGVGLSLDPSRIEVSASGECRPEAGKGAPPGRYRAPEIEDGRPATPQSQVYTAGVLCYEILAGRAFEPRGAPLLRDIRADLPRDLSDAVQACLEMDAEWRPKDLAYVLGLIDAMGPSPAAASPAGRSSRPSGVSPAPAGRAGRAGRGGPAPRPWPLLAFALVALAASIAIAVYRLRQPPPPPALPPPAPAVTMAVTTLPPSPESSAVAAKPASVAPSTDLTRPTAAPTPVASASARAARPSPSPSAATAVATPVSAPPVAAPPSAAPVVAATAAPVAAEPAGPAAVTSVSPPILRRGGTVLVDVHGVGLRSEHQVRIGRGREAAKGIEVMRQRYVSPTLLQALLKVDAAAAPGAYVLSLVDGAGNATNTRPLEVSR